MRERVRAALMAHPTMTTVALASLLGCCSKTVRRARQDLDLPPPIKSGATFWSKEARDRAYKKAVFLRSPAGGSLSYEAISKKLGVHLSTLGVWFHRFGTQLEKVEPVVTTEPESTVASRSPHLLVPSGRVAGWD